MSAIARLVEAAPRYAALLRSQYWQPAQLESYRERQLEKTLRAAAKIPFYAERLGAGIESRDLQKLPILKRADVKALSSSVLSLHPPGTRFVSERSSGTSGPAVELLFDSSHQRGRNAARIRFLRMNGWNPLRGTVWFVGSSLLVERNPDYQGIGELIRWFSSSLGVRFLPTQMPFREQVETLAKLKPTSLYAFPSGIDGILRILEETGQRLPSIQLVMCGGEAVDDSLRARTRKMLGLELRDNYGSTEAFLAFQCPVGSYHINAEHVVVEVVDDAGNPAAPGQMGRVLVTTLENYLMPLVRYEIGDYAIAAGGSRCSCGRTLPLLERVLGRQVNMFRRPDGSLTTGWQVVGILRKFPELKIFQVVQKSVDHFCVRYVADLPLSSEHETEIQEKFRAEMWAELKVSLEPVSEIERAPSGKFLITISEVSR